LNELENSNESIIIEKDGESDSEIKNNSDKGNNNSE